MPDLITDRAVIGMYYEELEAADGAGWVGDISMRVDSDQASETIAWVGNVPKMAEGRGQVNVSELSEESITIENKRYNSGIKVMKREMRRDKTNQIRLRIGEVSDSASELDAYLLGDLIVGGEAETCYDGQFFFDADHSEGKSGTQSNDISVDISAVAATVHGTPAAPSPEEANDAILQAIQQIIGFKDDQGRYSNSMRRNFLVAAPPSKMRAVATALGGTLINSGSNNPAQVVVRDGFNISMSIIPQLSTWTDKIAVFCTDGRQKPLIRQIEVEADPIMLGLDSEYCAQHGHCLFGAETWRNAAYGDWKKACLVTLT